MSARVFALAGALLAFAAVAAGAFGAHALGSRLTADVLAVFETAVRYHLVHGARVVLRSPGHRRNGRDAQRRPAAGCFIAGIVLFSGSLYLLALTGQRGFGVITPVADFALLCRLARACVVGLAWRIAWLNCSSIVIRNNTSRVWPPRSPAWRLALIAVDSNAPCSAPAGRAWN